MEILCIANQKGGTGKTTTAMNIAGVLAEKKKKVLLIDLDPQGGLTVSFGFNPRTQEKIISDIFDGSEQLSSLIQPTELENIDMVCSNKTLASVGKNLDQYKDWHKILQKELSKKSFHVYDYVIIDTQPDLTLLSTVALFAADRVIIPVQCEYLTMNALGQLIEFIEALKQKIKSQLDYRILLTMLSGRTIHERQVEQELRDKLGSLVLKNTVNRSIRFPDAISANLPIVFYDPNHKGAEAYRNVLTEIL